MLLGTGGHLVYYGPTHHAPAVLALSPVMLARNQESLSYDNPGDFIIDCLGLNDEDEKVQKQPNGDNEEETVPLVNETTDQPQAASPIEEQRVPSHTKNGTDKRNEHMKQLVEYFQTTEAYSLLLQQLSHLIHVHDRVSMPRNGRQYTMVSQSSGEKEIEIPSAFNASNDMTKDKLVSRLHRSYPTLFWDQVSVLYARRLAAFGPDRNTIIIHCIQIFVISIIISGAFSYQVSSSLELPYQVTMILSMITLYAMILQYLHILPIYLIERSTLITDSLSGYISNYRYIMSCMLTEIPIACIQCSILLIGMYSIHSFNPDIVYKQFNIICLLIGVISFQSLLTICCIITDSLEFAYSITFMVLSSGTIFGGFLIRYEKIIIPFQFIYFTAINAITQRALITNDLSCCYMTITCNAYMNDVSSTTSSNSSSTYECPSSLQYTGDGSDSGNLGQAYLTVSIIYIHDTTFKYESLSFTLSLAL